jgi:hypothetical protein
MIKVRARLTKEGVNIMKKQFVKPELKSSEFAVAARLCVSGAIPPKYTPPIYNPPHFNKPKHHFFSGFGFFHC